MDDLGSIKQQMGKENGIIKIIRVMYKYSTFIKVNIIALQMDVKKLGHEIEGKNYRNI